MRNAKKYSKKQDNLLLAQALASSKELISITDVQNRFIYVNKAFLDYYGYTESEILGNDSSILIASQTPSEVLQYVREKAIRDGLTVEIQNRKKDGTEFPVELRTSNIRDKAGNLIGIVGVASDITERKNVEAALRESEKKYREVVENASDVIYSTDNRGNFTYANAAALRTVSYLSDEITRHNYLDLVIPEHRERVKRNYLRQFLEKKPTTYIEYPFRTKSGEVKWFGQNASFILEREKFTGFHIIARDITERKLAEEALFCSERKYKDIFNFAPLGIYQSSLDGKFITVNKALIKILGYNSPDEMTSLDMDADVYFQKGERGALIARFEPEGSAAGLELVWKKKGGSPIWIQLNAHAVKDTEGRTLHFEGFVRDITERKLAEEASKSKTRLVERPKEALAEREECYSALFTLSPSGIVLEDTEGNIVDVNEAFCKSLGYTREELVGKNVRMVASPEQLPAIEHHIALLRSGKMLEHVIQDVRKDGTLCWMELHETSILLANGRRDFLVVAHDITERKLAEEASKRAEEALQDERCMFIGGPTVVFKWIAKEGWPVEYVSPNVLNQFGYTVEDFTSSKVLYADIVHPDDMERVAGEVRNYCESGVASFEQEYRIVRADGEYRWLYDFTVVKRDASGTITHFQGYVLDITERKFAEQALHASEGRIRLILENVYDVVTILAADGTILYQSPSVEQVVGYTPQEIVGKSVWELIHPEDLPQVLDTFNSVLSISGATRTAELRFRRKEGSWCVLESIGKNLLADPVIGGVVISSRDITERKQAEERLAASENRLRAIIEAEPECVKVIAPDGTLLSMNPAGLRMIEADSPEEVIGKSVYPLVIPEHRQAFQELTERVCSGAEGELQFEIVGMKGTRRRLETHAVPFRDDAGHVSGSLGLTRDITERKRAEEENHLLLTLTQAISDAEDFDSALAVALRMVCETTTWALGEAWIPSRDGTYLECSPSWYNGFQNAGIFRTASERFTFAPGVGLPGRVWASKRSEWIPDVTANGSFLRAPYAKEVGLRAGVGIPIIAGKDVIAVIAFFLREVRQGDKRMVALVSAVAAGLGTLFQRKRAEERLVQSEERYRDLFESTSDLIQVATPEGRLLYSNRAWQEALGYTQEEVARLSLQQIIHPDHQTKCFATLSRAGSGEKVNQLETTLLTKGGKSVTVEGSIVCRFESGKPPTLTCFLRDITERKLAQQASKQAEDAIFKSETQLREAQRIAHVGSWELDLVSNTLVWSDEIYNIFEIDPKNFQATYDAFLNLIHPEDREMVDKEYTNSIKDRTPYDIVHRLKLPDGRIKFVHQRCETYYNEEGKPIRSLGTVQDITIRKRSEEQLRKLSVAVEQSPISILITDTKGIIEYVNPKFTRVSGYTFEETRGQSVRILKSGETSPEAYKNLWETITAGGEWQGEFQNRKKTGEMYWDFATISPIINDEGAITHFLSVQEDITKRKQMIEDLRESEERYRRFFEDDLTGDFISTVDGKLLSCNPAFARIYGFDSVEEALQTDMYSLYSNRRARDSFLNLLREKRKLEYFEEEGRRKNGKSLYLISNIIGIFDENDELVQIKGYIFDDTERRLFEEQLRQSQKMESLGTLAGGIAHDFNNILNNILGFTMQLKKYSHESVKVLKYSETIERSASRGAQLSAHLLTVSRRKKREDVEMDVAQVIDEITNLCKETFPRSIKVERNVAPRLWRVKGDRGSLYQVLLNLTVNARDAMPNGGTLAIEARNRRVGRRDDPSGDEVNPKLLPLSTTNCIELCVSDTGHGMSEAVREKIFDPFFTTKEHGTGLGLSIVYNAVKDHHGAILVESEEGVGSTFKVYLSAIEAPSAEASAANESSSVTSRDALVLLVDDEEVMQELGRELLEDNGFKVLIAKDGVEAVEIYRELWNEISLVVLDLVMPRMDGGQTYMELKKINTNVKAFFCSGYTSDKVITHLLEEENLYAIQKPFHPPDFIKMVHATLKGK